MPKGAIISPVSPGVNPEKAEKENVKQEQHHEPEEAGLGNAEVNEEDSDMKQAISKAIQNAVSLIKMQEFKKE